MNALQSVIILNFLLSRYTLNYFSALITANAYSPKLEYSFSCGDVCLLYSSTLDEAAGRHYFSAALLLHSILNLHPYAILCHGLG